ncbi:uncharacterized protein LOC129778538 isoform X2 [Toxorhynchites rutilus septentrionalis]|uniref:uncharacterized protein LOC129778538 isoform X2 n=1 Tax=Toxorhynchites rutilus septentrionalis TaxID=329112 RepID=UPI0024783F60|nr:uncharacterized protein LOC129778538 isoform X2 [Toxorhynchites rutilus septentrionalis]
MNRKIDARKLIREVEKRPALWAMKSTDYSTRIHRRRCWEEISIILGGEKMTATERFRLEIILQKKWKNIRDSFIKYLQGNKRKSESGGSLSKTYMYSQYLQFLRDPVDPRETNNMQQESRETNNMRQGPRGEQSDSEHTSTSSDSTPPQRALSRTDRIRLNSVEERIIQTLNRLEQKNTAENDENRLFVLSLVPTMSSLPRTLNLNCRIEIMQIINKYEQLAVAQDNNEPTCSSTVYQPVAHSQNKQHRTACRRSQPLNTTTILLNCHQPDESTSPSDSLPSMYNFSEN